MSAPSPPQLDSQTTGNIRPYIYSTSNVYTWDVPTTGVPVSYTLTVTPNPGGSPYTIPGSEKSYTVTGLTNGVDYSAYITATSNSQTSAANYFRTVQSGFKPGPPSTFRTYLSTPTTAVVNVTPALSNGGANIGWVVVTSQSSSLADPIIKNNILYSSNTCYMSNLNPNSQYKFLVQTVNDPGYSPYTSYTSSIGQIITSGLLINLDPTKYTGGSIWYDSSSNGRNATINNYNALSNGYIYISSTNLWFTAPGVGTLSNWTMSLWFKPTCGYTTGALYFGNGGNCLLTTGASYLSYPPNNIIVGGYYNDGTLAPNYNINYTSAVNAPNNLWFNIVGTHSTFTGGTSSIMTTYLNSSIIGSNIFAHISSYTNTNSTVYGIQGTGRGTDGSNIFMGQGLIYNRALEPNEVLSNYNATAGYYTPY